MIRRLICLDCEHEFDEQDAEPFDGADSLAEAMSRVTTFDQARALVDPTFEDELVLIEVFCPNCGGDDLEDADNLEVVREMKGTSH
jgi:hypothetical protein